MHDRWIVRIAAALLAAAALAIPSLALAQGAQVYQNGNMVPGHIAKFVTQGRIADAGGLLGDASGVGLTPFGVQDNLALGVCSNSGNTTSPYSALCIGHDAAGNAVITLDSFGGLAAKQLHFKVNGSDYTFGNTVACTLCGTMSAQNSDAVNITGGIVNGPVDMNLTMAFPGPGFVGQPGPLSVNVGGYPSNSEIPANVVQGIVSKVAVPSTYVLDPWPNTAISGYITNANNNGNGSVVSLFGWAGATASGVGVFGGNTIASNCAKLNCANGSGFNGGGWEGFEINVNVMKVGSSAPIGIAQGLVIIGGSEVAPLNSSFAMAVRALGAGIPWQYGLFLDDAGTVNGVQIGQLAVGNNSASQFLTFKSTDATPTTRFTQVQQSTDGVLRFAGPQTTKVAFNAGPTQPLDTAAVALFAAGPDKMFEVRSNVHLADGVTLSASNGALNAAVGMELIGSSILLTGNVTIPASNTLHMTLPTVAAVGPGGVNVCVDSAGLFYKGAPTCP